MALKTLNKSFAKYVTEVQAETVENVCAFLKEKLEVEDDVFQTLVSEFKELHKSDVIGGINGDTDKTKKAKKTRAPSAYNIFIRDKMKELKDADASLNGQELMRQATHIWKEQKIAQATA